MLFKQGKCNDNDNYHPISIILIVEKVFHRVIYKQNDAFLTKEKTIFYPISNTDSNASIQQSLAIMRTIIYWA